MSTEEEYKELSAKLRYGLELAEQRLIEEICRCLCLIHPVNFCPMAVSLISRELI